MNLDNLLKQAKDGTITSSHLRSVARRLRERPERREAYTLIYILGRGGSTADRELIESFLHAGDPMLARVALAVLVDDWELAEEYRDELRAFIRGVAWDPHNEVRHKAFTSAGELSRTSSDAQIVADLLAIQDDPAEDNLTRHIAFESLARAMGASYKELSAQESDDSWAASILERAQALADTAS